MKKILMISGAALIAASAMGAAPAAKQAAIQGLHGAQMQRVDMTAKFIGSKGVTSAEALKKSSASLQNQKLSVKAAAAAAEEGAAETLSARYYYPPINTFYAGTTPDGIGFPYYNQDQVFLTWGLSGNKGVIPFLNLSTGAQAYEWSYDYMGPNDMDWIPMTAESEHLPVVIEGPYQMFTAPTLTAFAGSEQQSYTPEYVSRFLCGPDFYSFGLTPSNAFPDWDEAEGLADYWGVTTCPINIAVGKNTYTAEFTVDRNPAPDDADYYNENGACTQFTNAINEVYSEKYDISNIRVGSYIAVLPEQTQAYLMDQTWFIPYYVSTADVTLKVTVYGEDEEGYIITDKPLGSGEVILPAHAQAGAEAVIVNLEAVDEDGFPTSNPLVIDGPAYVYITGFNDPAISRFTLFFNGGTEYSDPEADIADYYACNAAIAFEFDAKEKGVEDAETIHGSQIWQTDVFVYGRTAPYYGATDYSIYYNILFPYVTNADGGQDMSVIAPAEGGNIEYPFDAYFLISGLIEEGLMTAETDADWFTFEAVNAPVEIEGNVYPSNQINITAQALPEGVEGRQAVIKFRGYASDFDLVISQGDVAGISNVAAANGPVEYFDLQGRKLNNAPATGIYLQRQGNKTTKHIAK
ncbi:MAG: hypothetical protein K2K59_02750 [Muribaculaceae bacterium]|nr:hypothetical protein [Muribaculaceae bacterium]